MKRCLLFIFVCAGTLCAADVSVDSVDYLAPAKYLEISDSLGDRARISAQAAELKGDSDLATIKNTLKWMDRNLKYDAKKAYKWRNYDDVMRDKIYGGCADQGIVCGVLLKAAGIPVVWVKTMDVSWIWDFKKGRPFKSWSGHVFLEVYVDKKWMLLNPGGKMLYKDYSPNARILPGNRFAYHKGNDPKKMIMSLQWEKWKRQTQTYFRALDESLLPVDRQAGTSMSVQGVDCVAGTPMLPQAFVIGNSPYYQTMSRMAAERGLTVTWSFNEQYDKYLPQAAGHVLLVETHNGVPIVPLKVIEKYFSGASQGLKNSGGTVKIGETTIVFLDFSKQLSGLKIEDSTKQK